jgi:MscS family membrane protein
MRLRAALLLTIAMAALPAAAQIPGFGKASEPPAPAPPERQETYTDITPRGAVYDFLMSARRTDYVRAAKHLDLSGVPEPERATEGPVLARRLKTILDHTLWVEIDQISDRPDGKLDDGLPPDIERIGAIQSSNGPVELMLHRVPGGMGADEWKFSQSLVDRIPALNAEFGYGWLGEHVPDRLRRMRVLGIEAWQAIGILVLIVFSYAVGWIVSKTLKTLLVPLAKRTRTPIDDRLLETTRRPARWAAALITLAASVTFLDLSLKATLWVDRALVAFAFVTAIVIVSAIVDAFASTARERLEREGQRSGAGVVSIVSRVVKALLACVAIIGILQALGFNVTGLLAGLGIGGIALALAAQKTVENLFGGLSIMADKPVKIGDYCRFGNQTGWIEDFGFRSTRIRTPERSILSVPNAEFSTLQIENLSDRDRIRFGSTIGLRYETTPDQMRGLLIDLRRLFIGHPKVGADLLRIRLVDFAPSALSVEIQAYIMTADMAEYYAIREDLLLRIMEVVAANGTGFAFPSHTMYVARDGGLDDGPARASEKAVQELRAVGKLPFPDFTPAETGELTDRLDYPPEGSSSAIPPVTPS